MASLIGMDGRATLEETTDLPCSICLLDSRSQVRLRCGHAFCGACLKQCAAHDLASCPQCRAPHLLDPDVLRSKIDEYRKQYRQWREGGATGARGEVAAVTAPPAAKKLDNQCKETKDFRDYDAEHERKETVERHYRDMRTHQTVAFVKKMHAKYDFSEGEERCRMTVQECFRVLENYVDSSDPDVGLPNIVHMLQTAEAIRAAGHPDWFQLVGLIHDMGKIMYLWGCAEDGQVGTADGPQWALGGDTWVVGCALPSGDARPGVVYPQFSALNPDARDPALNTPCGMYAPGCGIDNLLFAYGHDEYLYQMCTANGVKLPKAGFDMIRYHSAYPWHTGRIYDHLMKPEDHEALKWVLEFNTFDLYTKDEENVIDVEALWPYYQTLIDKYMPGKLKW